MHRECEGGREEGSVGEEGRRGRGECGEGGGIIL